MKRMALGLAAFALAVVAGTSSASAQGFYGYGGPYDHGNHFNRVQVQRQINSDLRRSVIQHSIATRNLHGVGCAPRLYGSPGYGYYGVNPSYVVPQLRPSRGFGYYNDPGFGYYGSPGFGGTSFGFSGPRVQFYYGRGW